MEPHLLFRLPQCRAAPWRLALSKYLQYGTSGQYGSQVPLRRVAFFLQGLCTKFKLILPQRNKSAWFRPVCERLGPNCNGQMGFWKTAKRVYKLTGVWGRNWIGQGTNHFSFAHFSKTKCKGAHYTKFWSSLFTVYRALKCHRHQCKKIKKVHSVRFPDTSIGEFTN